MYSKFPENCATLGVVSDTHGWLDPRLKEAFAGVEQILHAGDVGTEDVIEELSEVAPVTVVRGNIDGGPLHFLPIETLIEFHKVRIALLHIAGSPRRPNRAAMDLLRRRRPDVLIVGHSHIPVVGKVESTLWINPGAAGRVGFHTERFAALVHVDRVTARITMDRIHLGPRSQSLENEGPLDLGPEQD